MLGRKIGSYTITEQVHSGKRSQIFKATCSEVKGPVALKFLQPTIPVDNRDLTAFANEARSIAAVCHANVVQARDFGVTEEHNQPFLVLEYLGGVNLEKEIEQSGPLTTDRAVAIFSQVADALEHFHRAGMLHCDLKPRHIVIVKSQDGKELVKLVGFAMAKEISDAKAPEGERLHGGTPFYMSPEHFAGQPMDQRSDIYALGCTMYEALTGKPASGADNVFETMHKQMHEAPKSFADVNPGLDIPDWIESIVMKALSKQPDNRYQTAADLRADLSSGSKVKGDKGSFLAALMPWKR